MDHSCCLHICPFVCAVRAPYSSAFPRPPLRRLPYRCCFPAFLYPIRQSMTANFLRTFASRRSTSPTETILPDYVTEVDVHTSLSPLAESDEEPPTYAMMARPTTPLVYTFQHHSQAVTLLFPPANAARRRPVANINVALNLSPFAPLSYITTVRRGDSVEGVLIGEFEIAMANSEHATVKLGSRWSQLHRVLTIVHTSSRVWRWSMLGVEFEWDCRMTLDDGSPMCVCNNPRGLQIASLVFPAMNAPPPLPDTTLTVFPIGHDIFDHILLSGLIVARKLTLAL